MKKEESLELANFVSKSNRTGLNRLLARIYGSCDVFSLEYGFSTSNEKELRHYAQISLLKLQEE